MTEIKIENWVHVIFFAILIFLWRSAFDFKVIPSIYILLALLYGLIIECIQQQWVPHRSFAIGDLISDLIGCVLGLIVWNWAYRKK